MQPSRIRVLSFSERPAPSQVGAALIAYGSSTHIAQGALAQGGARAALRGSGTSIGFVKPGRQAHLKEFGREAQLRDDRIALHFSVMTPSISSSIREQLAAIPVDTFVWSRNLIGPSAAVETAVSRISAEAESPVIRVRKGLYWRTAWTRFGPSRPSTRQIVFEITGPGTGPAGMAAAHALGLTTQVPGTEYYAVPGRPPRPIWGVKFLARPYYRRELGMWPLEVALIEALKASESAIESEWPTVVQRVRELIDGGHIRIDVLREAVRREHDLSVREQFAAIDLELTRAAA
jgi:hypothetical protein